MTDDEEKAMRDALIFGTGWLLDGTHVPMEAVMTDDLVKRLREYCDGNNDLMDAAADRIEAQDKRIADLQQAIIDWQYAIVDWEGIDFVDRITPMNSREIIEEVLDMEKKDDRS